MELGHVHARNVEDLTKEEQWRAWLGYHQSLLSNLPISENERVTMVEGLNSALEKGLTQERFVSLANKVLKYFEDGAQEEETDWINGLSNLALLDKDNNSELNNSVFAVKRDMILRMHKRGDYVPICTQRLFMRYYTEGSQYHQSPFWTYNDQNGYIKSIMETLSEYIEIN